MGAAELRSAFAEVADPAGFSCQKAELGYEPHEGLQWQVLTFRGTDANGAPFVARSDRLRPEADILAAARDTAAKLVGT